MLTRNDILEKAEMLSRPLRVPSRTSSLDLANRTLVERWPELLLAFKAMCRLHTGQYDHSGKPYWMHPFAVMEIIGDAGTHDERLAALGHDLMEDTPATSDRLTELGFTDGAVEIIQIVTRPTCDPRPYRCFIADITAADSIGAMRVKLADNIENLRADVSIGSERRLRKYTESAITLIGEIESRDKPV